MADKPEDKKTLVVDVAFTIKEQQGLVELETIQHFRGIEMLEGEDMIAAFVNHVYPNLAKEAQQTAVKEAIYTGK